MELCIRLNSQGGACWRCNDSFALDDEPAIYDDQGRYTCLNCAADLDALDLFYMILSHYERINRPLRTLDLTRPNDGQGRIFSVSNDTPAKDGGKVLRFPTERTGGDGLYAPIDGMTDDEYQQFMDTPPDPDESVPF
jgi:hypothetical protein